MSIYGTLIMGPAGVGKSTFSAALIQHLKANKRPVYYVNLDPAADEFAYEPDLDVRDLVSLSDAMEELMLGPNGGLTYCFEFLLENMDFLIEPLSTLTDEYLVVFDMPGQIELYTHMPILPQMVRQLCGGHSGLHMRLCAAYLLESAFILDRPKFFAGAMSAMSAMIMMELPHVNILSKTDILKERGVSKKDIRRFLNPDMLRLDSDLSMMAPGPVRKRDEEAGEVPDLGRDGLFEGPSTVVAGAAAAGDGLLSAASLASGASFTRLNSALARLLDDFSLLSFFPLDVRDEGSIEEILYQIDTAIQFHDAQEPREPRDEAEAEADLSDE